MFRLLNENSIVKKHNPPLLVLAFLSLITSTAATCAEPIDIMADRSKREVITCEREKSLFFFLSLAASFTSYKGIVELNGGKEIEFETKDGTKLSGFKLESSTPANSYLLIMQGNGFPAGRLLQNFERIQKLGIDVYAFDYRGYMKSEGNRRFFAMLQDYAEIIDSLNSKYENKFIYATSFGGVIAANVIGDYSGFNLVLFDSVVSRASSIIKCKRNYDPIDYLPKNCKGLTVHANSADRFYVGGYLDDLLMATEKCGGQATIQEGLAHPFEESAEKILIRMNVIEELVSSHL